MVHEGGEAVGGGIGVVGGVVADRVGGGGLDEHVEGVGVGGGLVDGVAGVCLKADLFEELHIAFFNCDTMGLQTRITKILIKSCNFEFMYFSSRQSIFFDP